MAQNPIVTMTMNSGNSVKIELYPEVAPNTVNNFISLVKKGFYNNLTFHRVIYGFMIQEFNQNRFQNDLKHEPGVISMARSMHPDSAGSQFFIMHRNAPHLDGQYAAFGKVIEGMDEVNRIAEVQTGYGDKPVSPEIIKEMTVETFGVDYPEPKKM